MKSPPSQTLLHSLSTMPALPTSSAIKKIQPGEKQTKQGEGGSLKENPECLISLSEKSNSSISL